MKVVDASAVVEWLLYGPKGASLRSLISIEREVHAPHLLDAEVANVLRRLARIGDVTADRGRSALLDLAEARISRTPHVNRLPRMWDLRDSFSAYDAAYVVLAEALGAELLTCDARLAKAAERWVTIRLLRLVFRNQGAPLWIAADGIIGFEMLTMQDCMSSRTAGRPANAPR